MRAGIGTLLRLILCAVILTLALAPALAEGAAGSADGSEMSYAESLESYPSVFLDFYESKLLPSDSGAGDDTAQLDEGVPPLRMPVTAPGSPDPPTVNGLFYGDGDYTRYSFLSPSVPANAYIYNYIDIDAGVFYVAVVVNATYNDNVFGDTGNATDKLYLQSAGWKGGGNQHDAKALIQSDHLEMILTCCGQTWNWSQDYADCYFPDTSNCKNTPFNSYWTSDENGTDGWGTPPPGYASNSSFQWTMKHTLWDYTLGGTRVGNDDWKSVDTGVIGNITDEEGWNTDWFNDEYQWPWLMVYEWSMNLSACCGPITLWPVTSHNSPPKSADMDEPFPQITLADWGDAPDSYSTLNASNGAYHYILIGGPYLGAGVDAEADGQPSVGADGDDNDGNDDEDGVVFLTSLVPGFNASVQVTGTAGSLLDAWIDLDGSGNWTAGEQIATSFNLTGGADVITFLIPESAPLGTTYLRFRVSTAGGLSPTGLADDGEVEDYRNEFNFNPAIDIQKTVYLGHDACASCPGVDFVRGINGTIVTYCFNVTNTGDTYLGNITIDDGDLGIDEGDMTLISADSDPLAPGDSINYCYHGVIRGDLLNTANTSGNPTRSDSSDIPGLDNPTDEDDAEVAAARPAPEGVNLIGKIATLIDGLLSHYSYSEGNTTPKGEETAGAIATILHLGAAFVAQLLVVFTNLTD